MINGSTEMQKMKDRKCWLGYKQKWTIKLHVKFLFKAYAESGEIFTSAENT